MRYESRLFKTRDYWGDGHAWYVRCLSDVIGYTWVNAGKKDRRCNYCEQTIDKGDPYIRICAMEDAYDTVKKQYVGEMPITLAFCPDCCYAQYCFAKNRDFAERILRDINRYNVALFRQAQQEVRALLAEGWNVVTYDTIEGDPLYPEKDWLLRLAVLIDPTNTKWSNYRTSPVAWVVGISRALALQTC